MSTKLLYCLPFIWLILLGLILSDIDAAFPGGKIFPFISGSFAAFYVFMFIDSIRLIFKTRALNRFIEAKEECLANFNKELETSPDDKVGEVYEKYYEELKKINTLL